MLLAMSAVCAAASPASAQESKIYRGTYLSGFEKSDFTLCKSTETWWLETAGSDAWGEFKPQYGATVVMEVRATIMREPEEGFRGFGHLGAYPALIKVEEVLSMESDRAVVDNCAGPWQ